jgi:outer membrane usher protein FimD/PapC
MIELSGTVERKDARLPRFVIIPTKAIREWSLTETTTVDVTINGEPAGRRSLKQWDDARWFIDVPETICKRIGIDTGSRIRVAMAIADTTLPAELQTLIDSEPRARKSWLALTAPQQRMLRENVAALKRSDSRARLAKRELL